MGYDQEEFSDIIFDTGSPWFVLETSDCTDCTSPTYDTTSSPDTYRPMDTTSAEISQTYADGTSLQGIQVFDWVCVADNADTCVTDFKWMNVETDGLGDDFNGILGMCADVDAIDYGIVTPEPVADSYIEKLYESGVINEKIFAFGMRD